MLKKRQNLEYRVFFFLDLFASMIRGRESKVLEVAAVALDEEPSRAATLKEVGVIEACTKEN